MAFAYTSGNPDNLVGGSPAAMVDIRGPFLDIRTYLNTGLPTPAPAPVFAATNVTVREVGESGQIRAGRQLAATDFTNMGLAVPLGLWNLGDLTDASGNGRALSNKGSVPFAPGINGAATTAAQFAGSTGQALYIADTGAADPFRIRTGSWGCWFRTAKRGTQNTLMAKTLTAASGYSWLLDVNNTARALVSVTGALAVAGTDYVAVSGSTDVADDRWHHAVGTFDGTTARLYVDGAIEGSGRVPGAVFGSTGPMNIGLIAADATNTAAGTSPHYGRVDEAFVTADVLTENQIRGLYAARLPHTLAAVPGDTRILVRRRRRGGPLATTDFPTTPVRLHNFTAGALTDQGSGGVALAPVGGGSIVAVAGADGSLNGGQSFSGAHTGLGATDAGLPAALTSRSYGCWFKTTTPAATQGFLSYGTFSTGHALLATTSAGQVMTQSVGDQITSPAGYTDGLWHHAVVVEDNTAGDAVKRKLYLDGRNVGGSTVLNSIALAGANGLRVGAVSNGTLPYIGQIDGAFVYSGALTAEQVRALYSVGSQQLAASPKDAADHVEAVTSTDLLVVLDSVEASDSCDITVAP